MEKIEKHIEWLVLALGALWLVGIVGWKVTSRPATEVAPGKRVPLTAIDQEINQGPRALLEQKLNQPQTVEIPPLPPGEQTGPENRPWPAVLAQVPFHTPGPMGKLEGPGWQAPSEVARIAALPLPPAPIANEQNAGKAVVRAWRDPSAPEPMVRPAADAADTRLNKTWYTFFAKFPQTRYQESLTAARVPVSLLQMVIEKVELERREVLGDGSYGPATLIEPLPHNAPPVKLSEKPAEYRAWSERPENQVKIVQPPFYEVLAGDPPAPPIDRATAERLAAARPFNAKMALDAIRSLPPPLQHAERMKYTPDERRQIAELERLEQEAARRSRAASRGVTRSTRGARGPGQVEGGPIVPLGPIPGLQGGPIGPGGGYMGPGGGSIGPGRGGSDEYRDVLDPSIFQEMFAQAQGRPNWFDDPHAPPRPADATPEFQFDPNTGQMIGGPMGGPTQGYGPTPPLGGPVLGGPTLEGGPIAPGPMVGPVMGGPLSTAGLTVDREGNIRVWAHDETATPGHTYQYRLRILFRNPLYQQDQLAEPKLASQPVLEGEWTAWSQPITIPPDLKMWLVSGAASRDTMSARFQVSRWHNGQYSAPQSFTVSVGDLIGGVVTVATPRPVTGAIGPTAMQPAAEQIDFTTEWTLADVRLVGTDARVTLVHNDGRVQVRSAREDQRDFLSTSSAAAPAPAAATGALVPGTVMPGPGYRY